MTDVFFLHVEPSAINLDIRLFLEHGLSELAKRRSLERGVWPADQDLDLLCERAGGLFVYAVATFKFLDHACSLELEAPRKGFRISFLHSIWCDPKEGKRLRVSWRDQKHGAFVCTTGASAAVQTR